MNDDADDERTDDAPDHLQDIPDGSGCTEIWERLSERRTEEPETDES